MGFGGVRLAVLAAGFVLLGLGQAELAQAATGDVRADIRAGSPGGVSVAFDGQSLYYTDLNGATLHSVTPGGSARPSVTIVGAAGLNALTYDATREQFWAVDATGLRVYRLTRTGVAALQFTLVPALDLPGLCDIPSGCSSIVSGLAYDASDDSLWYAPQLSERVYHLNTAGQLLGYFDTNDAGSLFPDCPTNGVSGIAAGSNSLYLSAGACGRGFRYTKSDAQTASKLTTFSIAGPRAGDVECDNRTFAATVLWVRDVVDGHIRAVEVAAGTCVFGGGITISELNRWMSGGGEAISQYTLPAMYAFHIECDDIDGPPNNFVVNWKDPLNNHFSFHLSSVLMVDCFYPETVDDPLNPPAPDPPTCEPGQTNACFNTMIVQGLGSLRGRSPGGEIIAGATGRNELGYLEATLIDNGEPNTLDVGQITVSDVVAEEAVLEACGCERANHQAHQRPK